MTRWTLDHGQIRRDGEPILTLVRSVWGDGEPAAEIDALSRRIVSLLNAAESQPIELDPCPHES